MRMPPPGRTMSTLAPTAEDAAPAAVVRGVVERNAVVGLVEADAVAPAPRVEDVRHPRRAS